MLRDLHPEDYEITVVFSGRDSLSGDIGQQKYAVADYTKYALGADTYGANNAYDLTEPSFTGIARRMNNAGAGKVGYFKGKLGPRPRASRNAAYLTTRTCRECSSPAVEHSTHALCLTHYRAMRRKYYHKRKGASCIPPVISATTSTHGTP